MKQEFLDPVEIPTEDTELERLDGKIQYKKYLRTRYYKQNWYLIRACVVLSPIQKVIVALRFFENDKKGYNDREIGRRLGISRMTVSRKLENALFKYRLWSDRR